MKITSSTSTEAILAHFGSEEAVIKRFLEIRAIATAADAERDRLRKFIQELKPAKYGDINLAFKEGAEVCYPTSEGKWILQNGILLKDHTLTRTLEPGEVLTLHSGRDKVGAGVVYDNGITYYLSSSKKVETW